MSSPVTSPIEAHEMEHSLATTTEQQQPKITTGPARPQQAPSLAEAVWFSYQDRLPRELRLEIYDSFAPTTFERFPHGAKYMYFENNHDALAFVRNGAAWEFAASSALKLDRALQSVRFLADAKALHYVAANFDSNNYLRRWLMNIEDVYGQDQEHMYTTATSTPKSWSAPLHESTLKNIASLQLDRSRDEHALLMQADPLCTEDGGTINTKQFYQTVILQLRRKPMIHIRLFLDEAEYVRPSCPERVLHLDVGVRIFLFTIVRRDFPWYSKSLKDEGKYIRYRVTLVTRESKREYWKDTLAQYRDDFEWDTPTKEELALLQGPSQVSHRRNEA